MLDSNYKDGLLPPTVIEVYEALPVSISVTLLADGQLCYCNPAFRRLLGCSIESVKSIHQLIEMTCVQEDRRKDLLRWIDRVLKLNRKSGTTTLPDIELDIRNCKTGHIHTILLYGIVMHNYRSMLTCARDISNYKHTQQTLRRAALHDPLTGLSNRRGLEERLQLEMGLKGGRRLAFVAIDLDDFKPVNDVYGHDAGDEVLCIASDRLKSTMREDDLICRLGGDEFGILMTAPHNSMQLEVICERIVTALNQPMQVMGVTLQVAASVGVCLYPDHAEDPEQLVHRADAAMYRVKRGEKGNWQLFQRQSD